MLDYIKSNRIDSLKAKLSHDPSPGLFYLLSEQYMGLGMYDEAETLCRQGVADHPDYLCAHVLLGKIYIIKGLYNQAIMEFEEVLRTMPDNLYAYKKLSEIYAACGDKDKAVQLYLKVISTKTDDIEPLSEKDLEYASLQVLDNKKLTDEHILTEPSDINKDFESAQSTRQIIKKLDNMLTRLKQRQQEVFCSL